MWPVTLALLSFGWGPAEFTEMNAYVSRSYERWIASATVEDLAGQMIMVAGYSRQGESHLQQLATWAEAGQIGGIIWMQGGPGRQRHAIARTQAAAMRGTGLPLLNAQDAEWGASMRLDSLERLPWPLTLGANAGSGIGSGLRQISWARVSCPWYSCELQSGGGSQYQPG